MRAVLCEYRAETPCIEGWRARLRDALVDLGWVAASILKPWRGSVCGVCEVPRTQEARSGAAMRAA